MTARLADYGLDLTALAGALMILAFCRSVFLFIRSKYRATPMPARTIAVAASIVPTAEKMSVRDVIASTESLHAEEIENVGRVLVWSRIEYGRRRDGQPEA